MIKLRNLFCFILIIVCFWYQISGTRNPATGTRFWYQFSGTSFWYQFLVSMSWALDQRSGALLNTDNWFHVFLFGTVWSIEFWRVSGRAASSRNAALIDTFLWLSSPLTGIVDTYNCCNKQAITNSRWNSRHLQILQPATPIFIKHLASTC